MFILEKLLDIIAPESCLVCTSEDSLLCSWCAPDACLPVPSRCFLCQAQTSNFSVCKKCRSKTKLKQVWVATEYKETAKELVRALKFGYKRTSAKILADYMYQVCNFLPNDVIIMSVPTATARVRERGFDHARLIAKHFATSHHRELHGNLKRIGQSRQVGAKRQIRLKQLEGSFVVTHPHILHGKTVVLVDDVMTTGASLESAAKCLKLAGVRTVHAVVFAQTR